MEICASCPDYRHANLMYSAVNKVLQNHPLNTGIITSQVLSELVVIINLEPREFPGVDCQRYPPRITLHFDQTKYERGDCFDEELFRIHTYHELTHCIDRWNLHFRFTHEKEQNAQKELEPRGRILKDLWNLYIDGRLYRKGIRVTSFQDRMQGWFRRRIISNEVCSLYRKVWDADKLSYDTIVKIAHELNPLLGDILKTIRDCG